MITIDGSFGEGGGQILRTALGLSLVTGKPFRIDKIRAGRKKPGLLRQHLTAVNAATEVGHAEVRGAQLGSQELVFSPSEVRGGSYRYAIGTAGSATLVLQTVLPALFTAKEPSSLKLEGGTHNPFAPPFDFLQKAFLPQICRMGPKVEVTLVRPGFYPAGGGCFKVEIQPAEKLSRIDIPERGEVKRRLARALVANLPLHIATRELEVIGRKLNWLSRSRASTSPRSSPASARRACLRRPSPSRRSRMRESTSLRACRSASTWLISCSCPWPWLAAEASGPWHPRATLRPMPRS
jgi:RNA 3'-terminal phosphate cyclase (ATP)